MLLNSGTYIGYANDLKELLLKTFDLNIKSNDDQYLLTKYCIILGSLLSNNYLVI